jgi:hypothetical protein
VAGSFALTSHSRPRPRAPSTLLEKVAYDLERQMEGATKVSTSDFGKAIVSNI